jgi:preprotein translocase subunit SecD
VKASARLVWPWLVVLALAQTGLVTGGLPQAASGASIPARSAALRLSEAVFPSRLAQGQSRDGLALEQSVVLSLIPRHQVPAGVLDEALRIVDRRLTSLGLKGWRTSPDNGAIVVHLPAGLSRSKVKTTAAAVSQAGYLFFRPVHCEIAPYHKPASGRPTRGSRAVQAACHAGVEAQQRLANTSPVDDTPAATVVLPQLGAPAPAARYVLGPAEMNGTVVRSAAASKDPATGRWRVQLQFTLAGEKLFNRYAQAHYRCYKKDAPRPPTCALQAVELDGIVQEAAYVQAPSFPNGATINASFSAGQAKGLARALEYGALPVRFNWALETLTKQGKSRPGGAEPA